MMLKKTDKYLVSLLRWSERFTKTDMVYLVRGGSWLGAAQLAASASAFVTTMVLANMIDPVILGEYRYLLAGFALLCIIALPGTRTALRESTPKGFLGNLQPAFFLMMRWGALGSLFAVGIASYYFLHNNMGLAVGFVIIAAALPLNHAATAYLEYLTAIKELKRVALYTTMTRLTLVVTLVSAALIFPTYAWAILIAFLLGNILPNMLFHFKTQHTFVKKGDPADPELPTYAKHLSAMTALDLIAGQLDKVFVWSLVGAEGLAIFYIAYTLPSEVMRFLGIVPMLAFAKFGASDPHVIRRTLLPKIFRYLGVILLGAIMYVFLAPYIFALLFPKYPDAALFSQVLVFVALGSAFLPIKTYLTTLKSTKVLYTLSIVTPVVRISAAVLLITAFGVWGAVGSLLIEALVRSSLLVYFFLRTPKEPPKN